MKNLKIFISILIGIFLFSLLSCNNSKLENTGTFKIRLSDESFNLEYNCIDCNYYIDNTQFHDVIEESILSAQSELMLPLNKLKFFKMELLIMDGLEIKELADSEFNINYDNILDSDIIFMTSLIRIANNTTDTSLVAGIMREDVINIISYDDICNR